MPVVVIGEDLVVRAAERPFEQVDGLGSWRVTSDGETILLSLDGGRASRLAAAGRGLAAGARRAG